MRFWNSFNTFSTLEAIFRKLLSYILLLFEKWVLKFLITSLHGSMDLIRQTATWTCFRVSSPTISCFVRFGFNSEKKRKVLNISTSFSVNWASVKKLHHLDKQYKGSSAQIFLYYLCRDVLSKGMHRLDDLDECLFLSQNIG